MRVKTCFATRDTGQNRWFVANPIAMRVFLFTFLILMSSLVAGQSSLQHRLDSLVSYEVENRAFSGVVLVARQGKTILHRADGLANHQTNQPIDQDTRFCVASVTKLFTAVAILQLQEEGKLALTDKLGQYLPELDVPNDGEITIADLLLHNSGLPSEKSSIYLNPTRPVEYVRQTLRRRAKSKYGDYNYNNLDYVLLGMIIEKLRTTSWQKVISDNILEPAGLTNTGFLAKGEYPENYAETYTTGKYGKLQKDPVFYVENFYSAASMYSTAGDLLLLDQALNTNMLLSEISLKVLGQEFPENNYAGYSVWNYRYPFVAAQPKVMERRGGILGANVVMVRLPEESSCIIILSNTDAFNPDSFGDPQNLREALLRALYAPATLTNR